jgi:hypothetical protein
MPRYAPNKMPPEVKRRYFQLIRQGRSGSAASESVGVSLSCGSVWFIDAGSVDFIDKPISTLYLTLDDPIEVSDGLAAGEPVKSIAARIEELSEHLPGDRTQPQAGWPLPALVRPGPSTFAARPSTRPFTAASSSHGSGRPNRDALKVMWNFFFRYLKLVSSSGSIRGSRARRNSLMSIRFPHLLVVPCQVKTMAGRRPGRRQPSPRTFAQPHRSLDRGCLVDQIHRAGVGDGRKLSHSDG